MTACLRSNTSAAPLRCAIQNSESTCQLVKHHPDLQSRQLIQQNIPCVVCGLGGVQDECASDQPPHCTPMCAIAFHGFMAECGTTVDSLANGAALRAFEQTCLGTGTINLPVFIDALSHAECCSSKNCGERLRFPTKMI